MQACRKIQPTAKGLKLKAYHTKPNMCSLSACDPTWNDHANTKPNLNPKHVTEYVIPY